MAKIAVKKGRVREIEPDDAGPGPIESLDKSARARDFLEVVLDTNSTFRIRKDNPRFEMWREYINARREADAPVYVEADADTTDAVRVLPTYRHSVRAVDPEPDEGRLRVSFLLSPSTFYLPLSHPEYVDFRKTLERAAREGTQVQVTSEPDTDEIVDVEEAPAAPPAPEASNGPAVLAPDTPQLENVPPPNLPTSELTLGQAFAAFDFVAEIPALEIPFKFPKDCCTSRAQVMCHLLDRDHNIRALKIWNYASGFARNRDTIRVETDNHPSGFVRWTYHVAPVVSVPQSNAGHLVLDPSLFRNGPVSINTWLRVQVDSGQSHQEFSPARAYSHLPHGGGDVTGDFSDFVARVNENLAGHRMNWKEMRLRLFLS